MGVSRRSVLAGMVVATMAETLLGGAALAAGGAAPGAQATTTPAPQAAQSSGWEIAQGAVWAPKELRFVYQGFTSRYSCDGLRDKVREALLRLGARKEDLKVIETPCAGSAGVPTPFPGVTIRMSVLVPAGAAGAAGGNVVPARWKTVEVAPRRDSLSSSGECELVEQIKQKIVPLFTTRNVELSGASCIPHQAQPVGPRLTADVLIAEQPDTSAGPKS